MLKLYWSTQPRERPVLQEVFAQDHAEPCLSTTRTDVTRLINSRSRAPPICATSGRLPAYLSQESVLEC